MAKTLIIILLAWQAAAAAEYDRADALEVSQAALGRDVGEYTFRDTDGQPFRLGALAGKPVVISMIYTSCHHVCPTITKSVARAVDIATEALGEDAFSVVTIGFDWAVDTPDRMRLYAAERRIDVPYWHFLAGDSVAVDGLASDIGFLYYPSAKGFDHLTQTTILDREGRVYRQVYGVDLDAPAIVEPLKELVFDTPREAGLIAHWVDTFKLFCTVYDPNSGRYRFDYSIATTIVVGSICLFAIAFFIVTEWRKAR